MATLGPAQFALRVPKAPASRLLAPRRFPTSRHRSVSVGLAWRQHLSPSGQKWRVLPRPPTGVADTAVAAIAALAVGASSKVRRIGSSASTHARVTRSCAAAGGVEAMSNPEADVAAAPMETADVTEFPDFEDAVGSEDVDQAQEAAGRIASSMELLEHYSTEHHPGHQPGRFAGPGPEYEGMVHDPSTGVWRLASSDSESAKTAALAKLNQQDQVLVTKFEAAGGLALTLSNSFKTPDRLRAEARRVMSYFEKNKGSANGTPEIPQAEDAEELNGMLRRVLDTAGLNATTELLEEASDVERAVLMFQAADLAEEREAVMRNVWSDVEFDGGEESNAELVSRLEMQFARQLVNTTENRLAAQEEAKRTRGSENNGSAAPDEKSGAPADADAVDREEDAVFDIALRGCKNITDLAQTLPEKELTATLCEPRNLGVALDLVGVYLKNYEIDKADLVITRVVPLARRRGGTWLVKALDKMSAVRMKQFRAYDALVALREIEQIVPFSPEEGWEFHDILYRNLAWCYSSLDEAERCLEYTRKSVEVKKQSGIPASWFDIWDLGKAHARIGQKTNQQEEMKVAYDLCVKAGEIHRTAEPSDRIMLAKILSNVGEVAMGIGDTYHLSGDDENASLWYHKAEPSLRESYQLHHDALGPMKPLAGWAAGTVAHCMVRLEQWEDARDYLTMAWKVECTKDSTTPGSVIELLDRVLGVQQQLQDPAGMARYLDDLELCMEGLKARGWDRRERDVYALFLQKAATAVLLGDDGTGKLVPRALELLREARQHLDIYIAASLNSHRCSECGKLYEEKSELDAHIKRRHRTEGEAGKGSPDVAPKRFGPRADPHELLSQVQQSIRILEIAQQSGGGEEQSEAFAGKFQELTSTTRVVEEDVGAVASPASNARDEGSPSSQQQNVLGVFELRRMSPPFCTQLRYEPTESREESVFLPDILIHDGESVSLLRVDGTGRFGYVNTRYGEGWVQMRYLQKAATQRPKGL